MPAFPPRPGYTTVPRVTRVGDRLTLTATVSHTDAAYADPAGNLMVWLDGRLVAQHWGTGEVTRAVNPATRVVTFTYVVDLDPARRNHLYVTVWPSSAGVWPCLAELSLDPVTTPAPALRSDMIIRTAVYAEPNPAGPLNTQVLVDAGFNCVNHGAFNNPADNPGWNPYENWRQQFESYILQRLVLTAKAAGLKSLLNGDDFFRSAAERNWLLTSPWAKDAVQYAARRLEETGNVVGLELIDEFTAPLDDPATVTFLSWWREACSIPVAFPYHSLSVNRPWEAQGDYLSRYGTLMEWRPYSSLGSTTWQRWNAVKRMADGTGGKKWIGLGSCCGDHYRHATGTLEAPGDFPPAITAAAWLLLAAGASGVRYYALDNHWPNERATAQPGQLLQTGAAPGDVRWPAVSAAFKSIASREALLTQPADPFTDGFPWVHGSRPGLNWAVNVTDGPESAPFGGVLLTPTGEAPVSAGSEVPAGGVVLSQ